MNLPAQSAGNPKRPALIWFTQVLVFFLASVFAFFLVAVAITRDQLSTDGATTRSILVTSGVHLLLLVFLVALSIGLVRRHRWAWPASILLASGVAALIVVYRLFPPSMPIPILPVVPAPVAGPSFVDFAISLLVVVYPLRLLLSRKVHRFFGVGSYRHHGP